QAPTASPSPALRPSMVLTWRPPLGTPRTPRRIARACRSFISIPMGLIDINSLFPGPRAAAPPPEQDLAVALHEVGEGRVVEDGGGRVPDLQEEVEEAGVAGAGPDAAGELDPPAGRGQRAGHDPDHP